MAPAADLVAMPGGILVAFKAFQDVVAVRIAVFSRQLGGCAGARAATAEEQYQGFRIDLPFQLGEEAGVGMHARPARPFDFHCAGNASYPVPFRPAAHVYQAGARSMLQDLIGFMGRQGTFKGKIAIKGALLRQSQDVGEFAHGVETPRIAGFRV